MTEAKIVAAVIKDSLIGRGMSGSPLVRIGTHRTCSFHCFDRFSHLLFFVVSLVPYSVFDQ